MAEPKRKPLRHTIIERDELPGAEAWTVMRKEISENYPELSSCRIALLFSTAFGSDGDGRELPGRVHILNAWQRTLIADTDVVLILNEEHWHRSNDRSKRGTVLHLLRGIRPALDPQGEPKQWDDTTTVWTTRKAMAVQAEAIAEHGAFDADTQRLADMVARGVDKNRDSATATGGAPDIGEAPPLDDQQAV